MDKLNDQLIADMDELRDSLHKAQRPIESDGGSSSYYTLVINGITIETEDIIRDGFDNDFDFGTAFKSLVRAHGKTKGAGKAGNSLDYELNKINYSTNKIRGRHCD